MITLKQESTLIKKLKSLTELELQAVFEELSEHIHKNYWGDMVTTALDINDLRSDIKNLELDLEELTESKDRIVDYAYDARRILENIEDLDEDTEKQINKALMCLNAI